MTENQVLIKTPEEAIETIKSNMPTSGYQMLRESLDMAITALKEIQKYREIGTVEECKEMAVIANKKTNPDELAKIIVEWIQYNKIGTVEECREAVEKQKPKKPHRNYKKFSGLWCKCGWYLGQKQCLDIKYCPNCGQAILQMADAIYMLNGWEDSKGARQEYNMAVNPLHLKIMHESSDEEGV